MTTNRTKNPWQIKSEDIVESYPIFTIKKSLRYHPATGEEMEFLLVDGLNWVNVIAFTEDDNLVMVRQYRHGIEDFTLELPGGCVEKSEADPKDAGLRELLEETGYSPGEGAEVEFLTMLRPNPAMYNMKNFFYVARNCKLTHSQKLDEGEDIEIVLKPYNEIISSIKDGTFIHGMGAAALSLYELKRLSEKISL